MTLSGTRGQTEVPVAGPPAPAYPSLNLVRLALAVTVLVSHAFPAAGLHEPTFAGRSGGGWAVMGFFALSGFLITRSRWRLSLRSFSAHRIVRLLPAYWVCLAVTAAAAMLIARPGLSGRDGPLSYVLLNAGLLQLQTHVSGTPSDVPYPGVWNASAWTLPHEFLCYVVLGVAGSLFARSAARMRTVTLGLWIGAVLLQAALPHTGLDLALLKQFSLLAPLFFGGAVVAAFWSRPRPGAWVASSALLLSTVLVMVEPRIGAGLASPLITVTILWLGMRPAPALAMHHDISYGVYLYAFPVSQALAIVGLSEHFGAYALSIGVVTVSLGTLSWLVVERPTQRWVKKRFSA